MNKAILISIQPKWCELIANGKKTVEVRKTRPKLETPFKVYIYCTQGDALACPCLNMPKYTIHRMNGGTLKGRRMTAEEREKSDYSFANGKVIGEFVCDRIDEYTNYSLDEQSGHIERREKLLRSACMTLRDWYDYIGNYTSDYGCVWHISNLVIYDEPKELCEFYRKCNEGCEDCYLWQNVRVNSEEFDMDCASKYYGHIPLKRPPQSWCYVEELSE